MLLVVTEKDNTVVESRASSGEHRVSTRAFSDCWQKQITMLWALSCLCHSLYWGGGGEVPQFSPPLL